MADFQHGAGPVPESESGPSLTTRDDCSLIVPADSDIPVQRCASITTTLADLHTTCEHKFNNLIDLLERHCVLKMIKKPSYDILVVSGNSGSHAIWLHNPSTSARVDLEPDTYLFGVSGCRAVKEDSPEYDPMSPCSVRWSFHRPGSKELVGAGKTEGGKMREEDIGVESAKVFMSFGTSEPRLMTTQQAMKACSTWCCVGGFSPTTGSTRLY